MSSSAVKKGDNRRSINGRLGQVCTGLASCITRRGRTSGRRCTTVSCQTHRNPAWRRGGETPRVLCWVLSEVILSGTKTHGQKLKAPLGHGHPRAHHRRYEGSYVEVTILDTAKRLIEVVFSHSGEGHDQSIIRG